MVTFAKDLASRSTAIPGLTVWDLPVHGDSRGWFKENWQRAKMTAMGLPDFGPVQNNISFNEAEGTTRGLHAEPWDKWVSVATGRIFGAWVDLREGPSFGAVVTAYVDPSQAVFVPRGVANGFQAVESRTAYAYLVNDHWSPDAQYALVNLGDPALAIDWPIPLSKAEVSDKDRHHPLLVDVTPVPPRNTLVLGANGQLGRALRDLWSTRDDVHFADRHTFDIANPDAADVDWSHYSTIVNAAAFTAVDRAESEPGRTEAWAVNALGPARLARIATENRLTLVHVSTDYVFDGSSQGEYAEGESVSPLGVYGQSKAAGELAVSTTPNHYIVRTSWVIGDGNNFVRTMASLAARDINPSVVNDQSGRLTFTLDLARGIDHLLATKAAYGTYHLTNTGDSATWYDVAREVFRLTGHDPDRVTPVSTSDYFADSSTPVAPRPVNSMLDFAKIVGTGFEPPPWRERLSEYAK